jgi:hypothetical protein
MQMRGGFFEGRKSCRMKRAKELNAISGAKSSLPTRIAPRLRFWPLFLLILEVAHKDTTPRRMETQESSMNTRQLVLAGCAVVVLSAGSAQAGPCNTGGKDAGSGPTPGATGQSITTGSADKKAHPPTETMNNVAGEKAMSSQDAQRQQQGQPTAAQQAQGAKPSDKMADQGC